VRWTHDRVVACDGGGGPAGHPKIYINTDKPEIATCGYCGLPFVGFSPSGMFEGWSGLTVRVLFCSQANEHHRKHLESLPETSYPL
jgi:NADH dehydrogenase (ubiquinone) Fe-S protein 6